MGVDSFHPPDSGGLAAGEDDLSVTLGGVGERFLFLIFLVIAGGLTIVTLIVMVEVGRARRAGLSVLLEQAAEPIHVWLEIRVSPIVTAVVLLSLRRIEGQAVVGVQLLDLNAREDLTIYFTWRYSRVRCGASR
jgi:hypothetical protein